MKAENSVPRSLAASMTLIAVAVIDRARIGEQKGAL
jgi:hypothetical protein